VQDARCGFEWRRAEGPYNPPSTSPVHLRSSWPSAWASGRGTDIKFGTGVAEVGGLHVLGTKRHEARRVDRQLTAARAARATRAARSSSCRWRRERVVVSSLMEETIATSQVENAVTTRKGAKKKLRTNRKPRNRSEQMIVSFSCACFRRGLNLKSPQSASPQMPYADRTSGLCP
jgi:hypothetical protein